jgi:hypothetical protein
MARYKLAPLNRSKNISIEIGLQLVISRLTGFNFVVESLSRWRLSLLFDSNSFLAKIILIVGTMKYRDEWLIMCRGRGPHRCIRRDCVVDRDDCLLIAAARNVLHWCLGRGAPMLLLLPVIKGVDSGMKTFEEDGRTTAQYRFAETNRKEHEKCR